jgi:DNA-directed RNA polymerase II subunit RPB2
MYGNLFQFEAEIERRKFSQPIKEQSQASYHVDNNGQQLKCYQPNESKVEALDFRSVLSACVMEYGLIGHQLRSMNDFYKEGLNEILTVVSKEHLIIYGRDIEASQNTSEKISHIEVDVEFSNVKLETPKTKDGDQLYPNAALRMKQDYNAKLTVTVKAEARMYLLGDGGIPYLRTPVKAVQVDDWDLCAMPVMVGSVLCNTYGKTPAQLFALGEDPYDFGGGFIISGNAWVIVGAENVPYGQFRVFKNKYELELVRGTVIGKEGDGYSNSSQNILRLLRKAKIKDDIYGITIEVSRDTLEKIEMPFYIMMRLLGINDDLDIIEYILGKPYTPQTATKSDEMIVTILQTAFQAEYKYFKGFHRINDRGLLLRKVSEEFIRLYPLLNNNSAYLGIRGVDINDEFKQHVGNRIMNCIDKHFLPQKGNNPGVRLEKVKQFGWMIKHTIMVKNGQLPATDRDAYPNKRGIVSGGSFPKTVKTLLSTSVFKAIRDSLRIAFTRTDFDKVMLGNVIQRRKAADDFRKTLHQTIKVGTKQDLNISSTGHVTKNRLSTQLDTRQSMMKQVMLSRQITASGGNVSKTSSRAIAMRKVHNSGTGGICPSNTPEGLPVGINKAMAYGCTLTGILKVSDILHYLSEYKGFVPLSQCTMQTIAEKDLHYVFANGDIIGAYDRTLQWKLAKDVIIARRKGLFPKDISCTRNSITNHVEFWADQGRFSHPLIIVYNNIENPELFSKQTSKQVSKQTSSDKKMHREHREHIEHNDNFKQGVLITKQHIIDLRSGKINFNDLVDMGIVEMICLEEQINYSIASDWETLRHHSNDKYRKFTHMMIPISMLAINILASPYGNHCQSVRNIFSGNQVAQTCGPEIENAHRRGEKNIYIQPLSERLIVTTEINNIIPPGGHNTFRSISADRGHDQEDSLTINGSAVDRGFQRAYKTVTMTDILNTQELFAIPDAVTCDGIKSADYSKLTPAGSIAIGSIVTKGTVLIGKIGANEDAGGITVSEAKAIGLRGKSSTDRITKQYRDMSTIYHDGVVCIVNDVIDGVDGEGNRFIRVCMISDKSIVQGDKMSGRSGQKGTCGIKYRDSDMAFTADGEIIMTNMNPHAMPSRMTLSDPFETKITVPMLREGKFADGTIFTPFPDKEIGELRRKMKLDIDSTYTMYSGVTGIRMMRRVFAGFVGLQLLQKFAKDSYACYSTNGVRCPITNQLLRGYALRFGEMEKDVKNTQGDMAALQSKFLVDADGKTVYFCNTCGRPAAVNEEIKHKIFYCSHCGDKATFRKIITTTSALAHHNELIATGASRTMIFDTPTFDTIIE